MQPDYRPKKKKKEKKGKTEQGGKKKGDKKKKKETKKSARLFPAHLLTTGWGSRLKIEWPHKLQAGGLKTPLTVAFKISVVHLPYTCILHELRNYFLS